MTHSIHNVIVSVAGCYFLCACVRMRVSSKLQCVFDHVLVIDIVGCE